MVALATRRADDFYRDIGYEESAVYFRKLAPERTNTRKPAVGTHTTFASRCGNECGPIIVNDRPKRAIPCKYPPVTMHVCQFR
jgi:hypothetical protein